MPSLLPLSLCLTLAPLQIDLRHFDIAKPWSAVIHREYWVTFYNLSLQVLTVIFSFDSTHQTQESHALLLPASTSFYLCPSFSLFVFEAQSLHSCLSLSPFTLALYLFPHTAEASFTLSSALMPEYPSLPFPLISSLSFSFLPLPLFSSLFPPFYLFFFIFF